MTLSSYYSSTYLPNTYIFLIKPLTTITYITTYTFSSSYIKSKLTKPNPIRVNPPPLTSSPTQHTHYHISQDILAITTIPVRTSQPPKQQTSPNNNNNKLIQYIYNTHTHATSTTGTPQNFNNRTFLHYTFHTSSHFTYAITPANTHINIQNTQHQLH